MWIHQTMPLEATDVMRLSMTQSKVHTWFHYPQTPPNWNHPTSTEHLVYEIHLRQCDFLEPHVFHWELHTLLSIVSDLEKITILHITHSFLPLNGKGPWCKANVLWSQWINAAQKFNCVWWQSTQLVHYRSWFHITDS